MYESGYQVNTITTTGAMGLMALMPDTARRLGVEDPFEAEGNIDGGTRLIRELLAAFCGNVALALAAYNAGENAVRTFSGIPPFKETVDYVNHVTHIYNVCKLEEEQD
jgi:soluble lytic murein transglycosylase-like protein